MGAVEGSQVQGRVPVAVLKLKDRINLGNVAEIENAARTVYDQGIRHILLDMTQVPSITSAGLRTLLIIHHMLQSEPAVPPDPAQAEKPRQSPHLKLLNPSAEVRLVLQISGFDQYFESFTNQETAIDSFSSE
jgi:anti-anti-sigma regulatory factor